MAIERVDDFKLPLRQWLCHQVDSRKFDGLDWVDEGKSRIKIPWTQQNHPGWEATYKLFEAWAIHRGTYQTPPDYKKLKGNFRCALRKSESFAEMKSESTMDQQTGNYKIYKVLSPEEVLERRRKQNSHRQTPQKRPHPEEPSPSIRNGESSNKINAKYEPSQDSSRHPSVTAEDQPPAGMPDLHSMFENQSHTALLRNPFPVHICPPRGMAPHHYPMFPHHEQIPQQQPHYRYPVFSSSSSSSSAPIKDVGAPAAYPPISEYADIDSPGSIVVSEGAISPRPDGLEYMDHRRTRHDYGYIASQLQQCGFTHETLPFFYINVLYDDKLITSTTSLDFSNKYRISFGDASVIKNVVKLKIPSSRHVPWLDLQTYQLPVYYGDNRHIHEILANLAQGVVVGYDRNTFSLFCTRYCLTGVHCFSSTIGNEDTRLSRNAEKEIFSYSKFFEMNRNLSPVEMAQKIQKQKIRLICGTKPNKRPLVEVQLYVASAAATTASDPSLDISLRPDSLDVALATCVSNLKDCNLNNGMDARKYYA